MERGIFSLVVSLNNKKVKDERRTLQSTSESDSQIAACHNNYLGTTIGVQVVRKTREWCELERVDEGLEEIDSKTKFKKKVERYTRVVCCQSSKKIIN